eukprot:CAMPEP_0194214532 /NCGR_PEP_ID=MMETSP0156-20130528/15765_1 /TAXON_ID=33649 /ORGANISM="Thalassionema nitzschioides, Strain L26-B" /LENGTH=906 /DNA_ID=CAMNT_0038942809 /DNA_START=5 /DNA_END=2722 /DNA_ORIENTATION=+
MTDTTTNTVETVDKEESLTDGIATKRVQDELLKDASGEEGHYTGLVTVKEPYFPHCAKGGNMKYKDGNRRYIGGWHMGQWHGSKCEASFPNGDSYKGTYRLDQRHGPGLYRWKDGRTYEGDFNQDLRQGQGKYTWTNDTCYEGEFVQGQRQGKGRYQFVGGVYEGDFQRGQYHGYGVCTWDDGRKYKGEWMDGMAHGQGVEMDTNTGTILHEGEWQNDEPMEIRGRKAASTLKSPSASNDENDNKPAEAAAASSASIMSYFFGSSSNNSTTKAEDDLDTKHHNNDNSQQYHPNANYDTQKDLTPVVNESLSDSKGRQGLFRGMMLRGLPHGVGHMVYHKHSEPLVASYQGFWDYGDWKQGRVEYRNGDVFSGDFNAQFLRVGPGQYLWKDGRQYHGDYENDVRQGQGRFCYPNGDLYEGQFLRGMRHGTGRFEFADGSSYEGPFESGEFHGSGCTYIHKDGRVYYGDFCHGQRNALGKELYPDGSLRYEGEWHNDAPLHEKKIQPPPAGFVLQEDDFNNCDEQQQKEETAKAIAKLKQNHSPAPAIVAETKDCQTVVEQTIRDAQGNAGTYTGLVLAISQVPHGVGRMVYVGEIREGFWKAGYLEGHARAFFANGDFYEGLFRQSQRKGPGVYKWKDGRIYEGQYENDVRHGQGRFLYPSGDEYVGMYENGMRCGNGLFHFSDGSLYQGEWKNSQYHGYGVLKDARSGIYYKGFWKDGKKHGFGENCDHNGQKYFGEWHSHVYQRDLTMDEIQQLQSAVSAAEKLANLEAQDNRLIKEQMDASSEKATVQVLQQHEQQQQQQQATEDGMDLAVDDTTGANNGNVDDDLLSDFSKLMPEAHQRAGSFSWGALDGENQRWKSLEELQKEENQKENDDATTKEEINGTIKEEEEPEEETATYQNDFLLE